LPGSVIRIEGIEEIYNVLSENREDTKDEFCDEFLKQIKNAKECLEELRLLRERSSYSNEIHKKSILFKSYLEEAVKRL